MGGVWTQDGEVEIIAAADNNSRERAECSVVSERVGIVYWAGSDIVLDRPGLPPNKFTFVPDNHVLC